MIRKDAKPAKIFLSVESAAVAALGLLQLRARQLCVPEIIGKSR